MARTNAARLLDRLAVPYTLHAYTIDPDEFSAGAVAAVLGLPAAQVFKTLVARGERHGVCLAIIPGNAHLDLKALARAADERRCELVPLREVKPLTGYIRGAVTALACKRNYPVYLDASATQWPQLAISAGAPGWQLMLAPAEYITAVSARLAPLTATTPTA